MNKASLYIRKILALMVVSIAGIAAAEFFKWEYVLPPAFLIFSLLITRITEEKPAYLFSLNASDKFLTEKGRWWLLFKWVMNLSGLIYDLIALTLNGVYQTFIIFVDILYLVKFILFFIVDTLLRFLKLFLPPLYLLYRSIIHYMIKWPWWIYQLAFRNTGISINRNFYNVSYRGAFLAVLIILVFYGTGLILGIPALGILGVIFSSLPVIWIFGSIAHMRHNGLSETGLEQTLPARNSGVRSMKILLYYLTLVLVFLVIESILNLTGWIPSIGFTLLGIALNSNSLLSLLLLFLIVILLFAHLMLPAHVVVHRQKSMRFSECVFFLGIIGKKFLRYVFSLIPASVFSSFLILIPGAIVALCMLFTVTLRNNILDTRINSLKEKASISQSAEKPMISKNIRLLTMYKSYPQNMIKEFSGIRELTIRSRLLNKNLQKALETSLLMEKEYLSVTDSLKKAIEITNPVNSLQKIETEKIQSILNTKKAGFDSWKSLQNEQIAEIKAEINLTRTLLVQLPVVFLLTAIWLALLGGIILTVLLSYLANLFYDLFVFREDGRVTHFTHTVREIQRKDNKQPLLGFTLISLIIVIAGIIFILTLH